jgi:hypothetical protein
MDLRAQLPPRFGRPEVVAETARHAIQGEGLAPRMGADGDAVAEGVEQAVQFIADRAAGAVESRPSRG